MEAQTNEVTMYLNALKKRKWLFIVPSVLFFILTAGVIAILPSIYSSSATILVEGQEVPQELVQTTVTGYIEERLQSIGQMAFNRKNLTDIIDRFGLYQEYQDSLTSEEILAKMRENIQVENIQADVMSATGRATTATIAFTIAFDGKDPQKVLQTTNALISLFLEENLRAREEKALTTYEFLNRQQEQLREEVERAEGKIALFKEEHYRSLPELMQLNLQNLDRIQKDIDSRQEMIRTLVDRKVYLEGQLATVDKTLHAYSASGQRIMGPEEELKSLQSQYLVAKATRSAKHPDVLRLKQQITLLEQELALGGGTAEIDQELAAWQRKVVEYEKKYTAKHPDLIKARKKVDSLVAQRNLAGQAEGVYSSSSSFDKENPAYISLQTQIQGAKLEIASSEKQLIDLRAKYDEYVGYIERSPQVEQAYSKLLREHQNSSAKYQETMQKVLAARQSRELEKEHVSEKLSLIEPPVLAEKASKPKRPLLLVVGLVLSLGLGVGVVSVAEFMDSTVHDPQTLSRISGLPVLGVIPRVDTNEELGKAKKHKVMAICFCGLLFIAAICSFHLFIMPLDILVFKIMNKLQVVL